MQVVVIAFAITLLTKKPRAEHYMVTDDEYFITAPKIQVYNKGTQIVPVQTFSTNAMQTERKRTP